MPHARCRPRISEALINGAAGKKFRVRNYALAAFDDVGVAVAPDWGAHGLASRS